MLRHDLTAELSYIRLNGLMQICRVNVSIRLIGLIQICRVNVGIRLNGLIQICRVSVGCQVKWFDPDM